MTSTYTTQVLSAVGAPVSAGPGIAGFKSWIITAIVVLALGALAWWTMRPQRRATRADVRRARLDATHGPPVQESEGPHDPQRRSELPDTTTSPGTTPGTTPDTTPGTTPDTTNPEGK